MKINKYQQQDIKEDYIDVHYRRLNPQITGLFEYLDAMNTVIGSKDHEQRVIHISEIYYCEIVERKCFAYLDQDVYELNYSLYDLLDTYHDNGLIRISKSMCVNVFKVIRMEADFNMRMKLYLKNGEIILLNRNYKNGFMKYLKQLTGRDEK